MSIVEKAAEKLKTLQPVLPPVSPQPVSPQDETMPRHTATTIERLQEPEQLQERTRVVDRPAETAPLWHVDRVALERIGLPPADSETGRRLTNELRRIKRPLLGNVIGRGVKPLAHAERIVVTSAVPGEGKTFTAVNLALSLACEPDFEVLLVDGDIPKADITRVFGLEGHPGLMDVLVDEQRQPADVIVRTDVPNLMVVPVGERHPLTTELFGSHRMEYVLEALGGRNRRRLMVFDSSPLLATSESQTLVSHMGQVVMVVAAGHTPRQTFNLALQCLNDSQYVGLLLNMSRLPASENHYDSYYGEYPRNQEGEA